MRTHRHAEAPVAGSGRLLDHRLNGTVVLMETQQAGAARLAAPACLLFRPWSLPIPGATSYQLPVVQPLVVETGVQVRAISPLAFLLIVNVVPLVDFAVTE
jgi:hypothetical protein